MSKLTIDNFLFINDLELSQYKILSSLKNYRIEFEDNKFLPGLLDLAELITTLKEILKKRTRLIDIFPIPVKRVDIEKRRLIFDNFELDNDGVDSIFQLIKWSIPKINDTICEGMKIRKHSFMEEPSDIQSFS
jgi:hypothetical protein